jgi:hypothetical protein
MRRRPLLALLATGLAGCAGDPDAPATDTSASPGGETPTTAPETTSPATARTTGPQTAATPTPADDLPPPPGESAFAGEPCPGVLDACYHRADETSPVFVRPSTERVTLGDAVTFTLVNRSAGTVSFGPFYYRLWRRTDGGDWTPVGHREAALDLGAEMPPGGTAEWVVDVSGTGSAHPAGFASEVRTVEFAAGRYCFGVEGVGGDVSTGTVGCLFDVEARNTES